MNFIIFIRTVIFEYREYGSEALEKGKVFSEIAMKTFEEVAAETVNSTWDDCR